MGNKVRIPINLEAFARFMLTEKMTFKAKNPLPKDIKLVDYSLNSKGVLEMIVESEECVHSKDVVDEVPTLNFEFLVVAQDYKDIAECLWGLLDDIDTIPDMMKPRTGGDAEDCMKEMLEIAKHRHDYLESNGYELFVPGTMPVGEDNEREYEQTSN